MATERQRPGMDFAESYGPWAVIAGGSEGTGSALARRIAAKGVSLILIANGGPLEEAAEAMRRESRVEVVTARIDLSAEQAAEQIFQAVGDREVGLFVNNAGADWFGERFLEIDIDEWLRLSRINVDTMLRCVHRFGRQMKRRRRGGILLVNSGACYGGSKYLAIYSGSKAYQLNFAEALWSELRVYGVDVLTIVLGRTDTPGYRRRRETRGVSVGESAGLMPADDVAAQALERLGFGPVTHAGLADDDPGYGALSAAARRKIVLRLETAAMKGSGYKPETDL